MIDQKTKDEILSSIGSAGLSNDKIYINSNIQHIISLSSGKPRIQTNVLKKFSLIVNQPERLASFSSLELRCCVCKKVISYPAWHLLVKYNVNEFHYFVCFNSASADKPNTACFRS